MTIQLLIILLTNQCKRIYTDEGYNKLSHNLLHFNWDFISDSSNINNDYNKFLRQFQLYFNASFPSKISINRDHLKHPWMTKVILVSSEHKNKLYKDAINGKATFDYYIKYRNEYNKIVKMCKRQYFHNFVQ